MFFNNVKKSYLYFGGNIDKLAYREFRDANESGEWGNKIYKQWAEKYKCTSQKARSIGAPA